MPLARMLLINVGHGVDHLVMMLFPVVAALAAASFGESYGTLIALTTGSWVAFGAGAMPAGWIADRWSRRGMMAVFFLGTGGACLLTALAQNYSQIAAALVVLGAFASISHPVGISMLAGGNAATLGKRLAINGVWGNIGVAVSTLAAAALADAFGWRAAFIVPGIACIGLGITWLALVPASADAEAAAASARAGGEAAAPFDWKRTIALLAVITLFTGFVFNASIVSLPKLFDERLGALGGSALRVGFFAFGVYIVAGLAQLTVGALIDRFPPKPIFLAVAAALTGSLLLMGQAEGWALLAISVVTLLLVYAELPIGDALVARNAPPHLRSRIFGFIYVLSFTAATGAIPAIAGLHGHGGFTALFVVMAAAAAAGVACILLLPGRRAEPAPAAAE